MKRCFAVIAALMFCFWLGFTPNPALAQEQEETQVSLGQVVSVSPEEIILSEYDYDTEQAVEVKYLVTEDTQINNVDSLEDITVGEDVNIEYVVKDDENVAVSISVERMPSEEESVLEE